MLYNENHRRCRWFQKAFALHSSRRSGGSLGLPIKQFDMQHKKDENFLVLFALFLACKEECIIPYCLFRLEKMMFLLVQK